MYAPFCANPKQRRLILETVANGKFISVEYTGTLDNGTIFDSSKGRQPLEVHMGAGQMIRGFETQLMGMALNEKKVFTISSEDAYGPKNSDLVQSVPRLHVPPEMNLQLDMVVSLVTPEGRQVPARVIQMDEEQVTMDLNHPLAGESLTFEIEVVGISDTPTQTSGCCSEECGCTGDCSSGCDSGCE
jgi:peptidylprolyl isomerase